MATQDKSKLFRNGTILSFDEATESIKILRNASVLVVGDKIEALGENVKAPADAEVLDVTGKIIAPGFINTHSHMWQTILRTLAPNTTLAEYFGSYSQQSPIIKSFSGDDIYISCLEGYYEGLNGGVTAYVEHATNAWDLEVVRRGYEAAVDGGARVWWCNGIEGRDGASDEQQFDLMGKLGDRSSGNHPLVSLGIAYDRLSLSSEGQIDYIKKMVKALRLKAITLHQLGGPWPVENGPETASKNGLQDLDLPVVFSHCGFATEAEIKALREHDWSISITPESEMHFGHGHQTSRLVLDQASLGIDESFTFSGDILTQARLFLQSARNVSYNNALDTGNIPRQTPMTVEDAFLLATRRGGRAVRRDDIGVLKVGAKADIVCFDGDSPNMVGWTDPIAAVVLHANVGDIQHVMVGGEFRKRDGKLVLKQGNWPEFSKKFAEVARRIHEENPKPQPLPEKFWGMKDFTDVETMTTRRRT